MPFDAIGNTSVKANAPAFPALVSSHIPLLSMMVTSYPFSERMAAVATPTIPPPIIETDFFVCIAYYPPPSIMIFVFRADAIM